MYELELEKENKSLKSDIQKIKSECAIKESRLETVKNLCQYIASQNSLLIIILPFSFISNLFYHFPVSLSFSYFVNKLDYITTMC